MIKIIKKYQKLNLCLKGLVAIEGKGRKICDGQEDMNEISRAGCLLGQLCVSQRVTHPQTPHSPTPMGSSGCWWGRGLFGRCLVCQEGHC